MFVSAIDTNRFMSILISYMHFANDFFTTRVLYFDVIIFCNRGRHFVIYIQYYIYLAISNQSTMNTSIIVHLLHITIISGLFFYVGLKRNTIPAIMYPVLVGLGFIILGYHSYKLYLKLSAKHNPW
ncbi:MAG: hypothetical protein EBS59_08365, partial [Verrucomicrobia bacterium]|nr:hypothetical protein [Verrucomicrobiota bacterium]